MLKRFMGVLPGEEVTWYLASGKILSAVACNAPVIALALFLILTGFFAYLIWHACRRSNQGGKFLGLSCSLYLGFSFFVAVFGELGLTHVVNGRYPFIDLDNPLYLVVNGLLLGLLYSTYRNQRLFAESGNLEGTSY